MNSGRKLWAFAAFIAVVSIYVTLDSRFVKGADSFAPTDVALDNFGDAFNALSTSYFKELKPEELTDGAIEGMLTDLDPNTQFFDRRSLEQLRIKTQGKFGGLGIRISPKGGPVPVVMSVFSGTPADTAGLQSGDRIIKIEGDSTHNEDLQDIVDKLRGTAGEGVVITIGRPGMETPFDQHVIRDHIRIPSVGLAREIEPGIGYISMSGLLNGHFSENTGTELSQALQELDADNLDGLILDLRGNPGGLLTQAISVADKFLPPNQMVVSTKGRNESQNQEYFTYDAAVAKSVPLIVLVNGGSASASEIVAGAVQDTDRGLVLGTDTFGKGSVQTIRPIGTDKALKLTTAVYYTPSGRSIHRASGRSNRGSRLMLALTDTGRVPVYEAISVIGQADEREDAVNDLMQQFGLGTEDAEKLMRTDLNGLVGLGMREDDKGPKGSDPKETFKTSGGRTVHGGGGIAPDVEIKRERRPRNQNEFIRNYVFFDFAVNYAIERKLPTSITEWEPEANIVESFKTFISDTTNTNGYRYVSVAEYRLKELNQSFKNRELSEAEKTALEQLKLVAKKQGEIEFEESREDILTQIRVAIAEGVWGEQAKQIASLRGDEQFEEAVKILKNQSLYQEKMKLALAGDME
ncbi:MAG: S41 family peptidase [Candidatus Latescibacterota bacterium]|nr:S41 family peptidase [Candidatus Latescibacterota bacterium]